MNKLPTCAEGLDWTGWDVGGHTAYHQFIDEDDCQHSIAININGWFEICNADGEIAWSGRFPSMERAHRAAMAIIEGMAR